MISEKIDFQHDANISVYEIRKNYLYFLFNIQSIKISKFDRFFKKFLILKEKSICLLNS